MKYLVVYDSVFGNTKKVAELIGDFLKDNCVIKNVNEVDDIGKYKIVIIGSPTRGFRPTKDIVKFSKDIRYKESLQKVAFFDTRIDIVKVNNRFLNFMVKRFGYAVDTLEKIFKKNNAKIAFPSGTFFVDDTEGPLFKSTTDEIKEWLINIEMLEK